MYDIIIIGGGIAGLNCALQLSKNHNILLLDERKYLGGRIITNKTPRYEIGAARFNNTHKKLMKLVNQYNLETYQLSKNINYLDKKTRVIEENINIKIENFISKIIEKSSKLKKSQLQKLTFKELCETFHTKKEVNEIIHNFGYNAEFTILNAYDAIRTFKGDFNGNKNYYIVNGGLSILCNKMAQSIKLNGGKIKKKTHVDSVCQLSQNHFVVADTKQNLFNAKKIIFAIKPKQLRKFRIVKNIFTDIHSIKSVPLIRVYAKYRVGQKGVWFKGMRRTTTNSFLRQIIPINENKGLIMISYVDEKDTKVYLENKKLLDKEIVKNKIQNEIKLLFPDKYIPNPIYFKCHLWTEGVHFWKKGVDSIAIHNKVLNPSKNIYICGEGFSLNQAWIEGSLDTSDKVISLINR